MAKISARGATELARTVIVRTDPEVDGGQVNYDMVLRSDGVILQAITWPRSTDANLRRKSYKVATTLRKDRNRAQWGQAFERFIQLKTEVLT